jgi:hypothetical protein
MGCHILGRCFFCLGSIIDRMLTEEEPDLEEEERRRRRGPLQHAIP